MEIATGRSVHSISKGDDTVRALLQLIVDTFQTPVQHIQEGGIRVHHIQHLHGSLRILAVVQQTPAKSVNLSGVGEYRVQWDHSHVTAALIGLVLCSARTNSTVEAQKLSSLDLLCSSVRCCQDVRCNPALLEPLAMFFTLDAEFVAGKQITDLVILAVIHQNAKVVTQRIKIRINEGSGALQTHHGHIRLARMNGLEHPI